MVSWNGAYVLQLGQNFHDFEHIKPINTSLDLSVECFFLRSSDPTGIIKKVSTTNETLRDAFPRVGHRQGQVRANLKILIMVNDEAFR